MDRTMGFFFGLVTIFWGIGIVFLIAWVIKKVVDHSKRPNIF